MHRKTSIFRLYIQSLLICSMLAVQSLCAQDVEVKHVVQDLDNYYSLSLKYNVSVSDLKEANPGILNPKRGDILIIPVKGASHSQPASKDCTSLKKARHETLRVALLIPLELEQVADSGWIENLSPSSIDEIAPFRFIQFYQGFMMAADSLRREGLNVEIHVYDVDQQLYKALKVINDPDLKRMDIIFGPFYKNTFSPVADFALSNHICLVNPLTSREDILQGNPYVFKLMPSVESQPELLAELAKRDFPGYRIIFYTANKYQNSELTAQFQLALNDNEKEGKNKVYFVDYASDSLQGFFDHASLAEPNLVIIYSENDALPAAMLSRLSELKKDYQITVIGLPEWEKFGNIELKYLVDLDAVIFMPSYIDYNSEKIKEFILAYRQKYFDEPLNYAFSGFDAAYFFLRAMLYFGDDFEKCLNETGTKLIQNQYHFEKKNDGGYDNISWNILQFYDYSLIRK
jgi:ABC-type branched-subunit amino acid transport system substrate-binding protein